MALTPDGRGLDQPPARFSPRDEGEWARFAASRSTDRRAAEAVTVRAAAQLPNNADEGEECAVVVLGDLNDVLESRRDHADPARPARLRDRHRRLTTNGASPQPDDCRTRTA